MYGGGLDVLIPLIALEFGFATSYLYQRYRTVILETDAALPDEPA
jgi:hypothetical protein